MSVQPFWGAELIAKKALLEVNANTRVQVCILIDVLPFLIYRVLSGVKTCTHTCPGLAGLREGALDGNDMGRAAVRSKGATPPAQSPCLVLLSASLKPPAFALAPPFCCPGLCPCCRFTEAYHAQEHLEAQPPAAKRAVRAQVSDCSSDELHLRYTDEVH